MANLYILVGLPGSGKSTYAKKYIQEHQNTVIESSDSIRKELYGSESVQSNPGLVFKIMKERTLTELSNEKDVIYDATSLTAKERRSIIEYLKNNGCKFEASAVCFDIPIEECIARNNQRERVVPEEVIRKMAERITKPNLQKEGLKEIITCDQNLNIAKVETEKKSRWQEEEFAKCCTMLR